MQINDLYITKYKTNTIAVDFDGVITEFTDDIEEFGKIIPGVREALADKNEKVCEWMLHFKM